MDDISQPDQSVEAQLDLVIGRFSYDDIVAILASAPALASQFLQASQPFIERQDTQKVQRAEWARLEVKRKESEARRDKPEAHVAPLIDELPKRDGSEPLPAQEMAEIQKRVEDGIRALVAHIVDPAQELKPEHAIFSLSKLYMALERTTPNAKVDTAVVPLAWDCAGLVALAVEAQRDRLEPLERGRVACSFERSFATLEDWEIIWHGYLHETTYFGHRNSLIQDPLNTPQQVLRIPARCKVPTERSSSLLQSLPFEILALIIKAATSDFIPHPRSRPARAATLVALRHDVLRTLAQVGRAWRPHAQRELVKEPIIRGSIGLESFLSTIKKRKLASLVRELHLDGGKPVRRVAKVIKGTVSYGGRPFLDPKFEAEADKDYADALELQAAVEKGLWTPLVRLCETCPSLTSLRLCNLANLNSVTDYLTPLCLQSLTLQSLPFPATTIKIPSSIRTLSFLNVTFRPGDHFLKKLRHFTPSRLDTLILLDCTTSGNLRIAPRHPKKPVGSGILDTVSTLHLDASVATWSLLRWEEFPAVTTLELYSVRKNEYLFTAPSDLVKAKMTYDEYRAPHRRPGPTWAERLLCQTCDLTKLERLVMPDEKDWRDAWTMAEEHMEGDASSRAQLALRPKPVEVVWR